MLNEYSKFLDKMLLQTLNNHPVHILTKEGEFSPSSFIPFCSFGKEFIGTRTDEFELPVCNISNPMIHLDQICYEMNLQEMKDSNDDNLMNQLEWGLTLAMDYNEERQLLNTKMKEYSKNEVQDNHFTLYLDTISILFYDIMCIIITNKPYMSCLLLLLQMKVF